jgi:predicted O-linked N-acetylglucosamine transferase (SPINDLY family)
VLFRSFAPLPPPANDRDPERRLRIGYVSSEFRQHLFLSEFLPVLRRHDHRRFEIFCYADVATPDGRTEEIRRLADHWRDQRGRSFDARAAEIRADGIDILVCLTGYLAEQRVLFARRLAPVQVAYINQVGTSGLAAMDYRVTDAWVDPPGRAEPGNIEALERLPGGYSTWEPPSVAPDPGPLPALANGHVTFGVFNNLAKLSGPALALWGEIFAAVPTARLLLKAPTLSDDGTRVLLLDRLAAAGVARERVELIGPVPRFVDALAVMARADIALDPFPFNGGISTREILWMGVPVVSLSGDRFVGRLGASTLARVGLGDLVASDPAGYRDRAIEFARDLDRLTALRAGMRARVAGSMLCDAPRHTDELETAYRAMWRRWCAQARSGGG